MILLFMGIRIIGDNTVHDLINGYLAIGLYINNLRLQNYIVITNVYFGYIYKNKLTIQKLSKLFTGLCTLETMRKEDQ